MMTTELIPCTWTGFDSSWEELRQYYIHSKGVHVESVETRTDMSGSSKLEHFSPQLIIISFNVDWLDDISQHLFHDSIRNNDRHLVAVWLVKAVRKRNN